MSEFIANIDREITVINTVPSGAIPNIDFTDTVDAKCDAPEGSDILVQQITGIPTGCVLTGYAFVSGIMTPMLATALKAKCGGLPVMRKGDSTVCAGSFFLSPSTTQVCSCTVEITNAGQSKVMAE